jgi:hypothetical protein
MSGVLGTAYIDPPIPAGLMTTALAAEMEDALRAAADQLTELEVFNISARTPVRTGALLADVTGETNVTSDILSYVYFDTANQLDEYNRVYVQYQEGGILGASTYTNPPRLMVASAVTDDIPDIEQWGNQALTDWAAVLLGGA